VPSDAADVTARPRRAVRGWLVAALVVGIVVVDQLTKTWAVRELDDGPVELFGDVAFRLSHNSGGAFSLFQGFTPLLAVLAIVLTVVLVRALHRTRDPLVLIALALILGGAIGNLLDRLFRSPGFLRGEVVDFVDVGRFPVFNVADSAITIGAVLLFIAVLLAPDPEADARPDSHPDARPDSQSA
jgi:signal peptidase II